MMEFTVFNSLAGFWGSLAEISLLLLLTKASLNLPLE